MDTIASATLRRVLTAEEIRQVGAGTWRDVRYITPERLWGLLRSSAPVVVLDVRIPRVYAEGHIPGALSVPLENLAKAAKGLSKSQLIVVYCGDEHCPIGPLAVRRLRRKGFRFVFDLDGGLRNWRVRGYGCAVGELDRSLKPGRSSQTP